MKTNLGFRAVRRPHPGLDTVEASGVGLSPGHDGVLRIRFLIRADFDFDLGMIVQTFAKDLRAG